MAQRVMNVYLRGVRVYMDELKDGRIVGKGADEVIAGIVRYTPIKGADLLKRITPVVINPDGPGNFEA